MNHLNKNLLSRLCLQEVLKSKCNVKLDTHLMCLWAVPHKWNEEKEAHPTRLVTRLKWKMSVKKKLLLNKILFQFKELI